MAAVLSWVELVEAAIIRQIGYPLCEATETFPLRLDYIDVHEGTDYSEAARIERIAARLIVEIGYRMLDLIGVGSVVLYDELTGRPVMHFVANLRVKT